MRWALGVIGALALAAGITVGGWDLGWWAQGAALRHQLPLQNQRVHNTRAGYEYQSTLVMEVENYVSQIRGIDAQEVGASAADRAALAAQRTALVNQACDLYRQVQPPSLTPDVAAFGAADCAQGAP